MAKRRKLEAPTADDLGKIEAEFRRETTRLPRDVPIAQVAAEISGMYQVGTPEMRQNEAEAAAYHVASKEGRLIREVPLAEIEVMAMQRDRTQVDAEAQAELEHSIQAHGLRLPIEIYPLKTPQEGRTYGLLSGYRRYLAQQSLLARTGDKSFAKIRALVRDPDALGGGFVAMVEENEIRQDLSHYERGRIAAIAAQQGAFADTETAVAQMFAAASKAKRSKIRSFAMIFEELGDVLQHPEALREKDGLRLAQALRGGAAGALREVLGAGQAQDAKAEWALIEPVLAGQKPPMPDPKRGGRPVAAVRWDDADTLTTRTGVTLRRVAAGTGMTLQFMGRPVPKDLMEKIMVEVKRVIEKG